MLCPKQSRQIGSPPLILLSLYWLFIHGTREGFYVAVGTSYYRFSAIKTRSGATRKWACDFLQARLEIIRQRTDKE